MPLLKHIEERKWQLLVARDTAGDLLLEVLWGRLLETHSWKEALLKVLWPVGGPHWGGNTSQGMAACGRPVLEQGHL